MARKKRKSVIQLVKDAIPVKSGISWYEQLKPADQLYVRDIVAEVIANPEAALSAVAYSLIMELSIDRSTNTVTRTLREMIRDA